MQTNRFDILVKPLATKADRFGRGWGILVFLVLLKGTFASSLDTLSGTLPSRLPNNGRAYLVVADIMVSPGATVTIEPGVALLFQDFTGINIHGALNAEGTADAPVVFTSANNREHNPHSTIRPAAYDWNGITITQSGVGSHFSHCIIEYSLFGINALTEQFILKDCRFRSNGRSDLTIKGEEVAVSKAPFSHGEILDPSTPPPPPSPSPQPPLGTLDTVQVEQRSRPEQPSRSPGKIVLRSASLSFLVAGTAVAAWKGTDYLESKQRFQRLDNSTDPDNLQRADIAQAWEDARKKRDNDLLAAAVAAGVAALGASGFIISFTF